MATITLPTTFVDGTVPTAAQFNNNFTTITNEFNGGISNSNIASNAAIAFSKLESTPATLTGTETFTNKTLTAPVLSGTVTGTYTLGGTATLTKPTVTASVQTITADTDGATITFNMNASNVHTVTLGGNRTLAVSNVTAGQFFYIRLLQDGTGSRTVTWFSTITWSGAAAPALTTTANRADLFAFFAKTATTFDGFIVGQNIG